jgi:hypothetical protein
VDAQQFATAYALTTTVGLRAFVTLALASIAMHFRYLHPSASFAWLGSDGATLSLAALAVVELASEKIPIVDHFMHAIHFATKPIAAAILVGAVLPEPNGGLNAVDYAAMAAGALNAFGVHAASATVRAASTATTMGVANPLVSIVEDLLAVAGVVLTLVVPVLAAIGALALTLAIVVLARRVWRRTRPTAQR